MNVLLMESIKNHLALCRSRPLCPERRNPVMPAGWWKIGELNPDPFRYERNALPVELIFHVDPLWMEFHHPALCEPVSGSPAYLLGGN